MSSRTGATAPGAKAEDSGNDGGSDRKQSRVIGFLGNLQGFLGNLQGFLGNLQGSITAMLGLIATVGALLYGTHRLAGQPKPQQTVFVTVTASATAASQGAATPRSAPDPSVGKSVTVNRTDLESLTPVQNGVDRFATHQPQQIGTITYPDAIRFSCSSSSEGFTYNSLVYKVAGYKTLNATFGIPSDATNAAGNSATIKFYKDGGSTQLGQTYTIALDSPQEVRLPLQGSSQLKISCDAANQDDPNDDGDDIDVIIGDATLSP